MFRPVEQGIIFSSSAIVPGAKKVPAPEVVLSDGPGTIGAEFAMCMPPE